MADEPSHLLSYLSDYKVIVCTSCRYALQPTGILRHLKDIHHILRSRRTPFVEHISQYPLADVETVIRSTDTVERFPVSGLPVFNGLKCQRKDCAHLCVAEKRMQAHWSSEHNEYGRPGIDWRPVPLQTFFRGKALRYFTRPTQSIARPMTAGTDHLDETFLMQHFVHSTSLTLSDESHTDGEITMLAPPISMWQDTIPEMAKTHRFLALGLLACSAFHLAFLDLSRRQDYLVAAATYQDLALPEFRSQIAHVDEHNCHAILAFVHVFTLCAFASEPENERLLIVDPNGPEIVSGWLSILRSTCGYVQTVKEIVAAGPMQALLCHYVVPDSFSILTTPLVTRLLSVIPASDSEDAWTDEECQVYRRAVQELGHGFVFANSLGRRFNIWIALRVWPIIVSIECLSMLRDEHPGALLALAQYCVLLRRVDGNWYAEGRAKRLLGHILQRLDLKWHPYIDWSQSE